MGSRLIEGGSQDVVFADDTYFPIIIATWIGPASERAVRGYFAWLDEMLARAVRESTPVVNLTDSGLAGLPSADVRRLIAELTAEWGRRGADAHAITAFVVVDSAVMRATLSALAWLHGGLKTTHFATCEAALDAAIEVLAEAGRKPPAGLVPSKWRRPTWSPRGR